MLCEHRQGMTGSRSLPLLKVFGIRVGVNYSWFLILFLVIYIVWDSLRDTLDASNTTLYVVAVVSAFTFFGSILLHELGHALAARREGIGVEGIDLFLFGGVMKMTREPDSPGAEFRVAAAGPLVTLLIMAGAAGAAVVVAGADGFWDARGSRQRDGRAREVVLSLLVSMNLVLLVFNLVPAFPLDGGRIARALAWKLTGDRHKSTRIAAFIGVGFGWILIGCGQAARSSATRCSTACGSPRSAGCSTSSARGALAQYRVHRAARRHHGGGHHGRRARDDPRRAAGRARVRRLLPPLPRLGLVRRRRGRRSLRRPRAPRRGGARRAARGRGHAGARGRRRRRSHRGRCAAGAAPGARSR